MKAGLHGISWSSAYVLRLGVCVLGISAKWRNVRRNIFFGRGILMCGHLVRLVLMHGSDFPALHENLQHLHEKLAIFHLRPKHTIERGIDSSIASDKKANEW
ncbi:hypothetical protein V9T40_002373 [Parthenolecanium corni]|uniref:Uncharacterized protein n=1 Tax=Parthenolecanium corni TaxID=536013 RepID=A0AAN9Y5B5_9HEMI